MYLILFPQKAITFCYFSYSWIRWSSSCKNCRPKLVEISCCVIAFTFSSSFIVCLSVCIFATRSPHYLLIIWITNLSSTFEHLWQLVRPSEHIPWNSLASLLVAEDAARRSTPPLTTTNYLIRTPSPRAPPRTSGMIIPRKGLDCRSISARNSII